jgi:hypothetical protein
MFSPVVAWLRILCFCAQVLEGRWQSHDYLPALMTAIWRLNWINFRFRFWLFCAASLSWCPALDDQIFITVGHLRSSCCGAPFLTRGWVCNLLVQFAVTLRNKSHRTQGHNCLIWDSPNLEGQVPVFISRRNRVAHTPGHWVPFLSPLTNSAATVEEF